ncbi:hypothetical protein [Listeria floridensis]|uniref:hypothetical protein n=1 Tax=Listeria floridensis TaxID=1494962 RepID=UPI0004B22919|nr:hypothetical protein [Listeria floridensis]
MVVTLGGRQYATFASASGYYFVSVNPNDAVSGAEVSAIQISNNIESQPVRLTIGM